MAEKKREHLHRKFSLNREIVLKTPFLCQWRSWAAGFSKNEQLSTHIFSVMRRYRTRVSELVSKAVEPTWLMWPWWVKIPNEQLHRWTCHKLTYSLTHSTFTFDIQRATLVTYDLLFFDNVDNVDNFDDQFWHSRYPLKMMTPFMNSPRQLFAHDGAHPSLQGVLISFLHKKYKYMFEYQRICVTYPNVVV